MSCSRALLRIAVALLTAAALALSGLSIAVAADLPMPADCPHHAAAADHAGDPAGHGDAAHQHGDPAKSGPCQCPLMACGAVSLLPPAPAAPPVAFAAERLSGPARAPVFAGHPPGPPFEPPRA